MRNTSEMRDTNAMLDDSVIRHASMLSDSKVMQSSMKRDTCVMRDASKLLDSSMAHDSSVSYRTQPSYGSNVPWIQTFPGTYPDKRGSLNLIHEGRQMAPDDNRDGYHNRLDQADCSQSKAPRMDLPAAREGTSKPLLSPSEMELQRLQGSLLLDDLMAIISDEDRNSTF